AITIAVSTAVSAFNSLTLSPALAGVLFKPHSEEHSNLFLARFGRALANGFNNGFDRMADGYAWLVHRLVGTTLALAAMLLVFAGLLYATYHMLQT
ncbi:MAG: efflux RND transporter permease subunit, partial [Mesorhizobium sp.]